MPADTRAKMGESWQALVTKLMALGFGCIGYALTFVIRMMPSMLEVGILITGVVAGPTVGLFIAGMFLPCVDARAARGRLACPRAGTAGTGVSSPPG